MANHSTMNRQYIEQQHVLTRYLGGQLSDAEREAFEKYYVEHPDMLQELEIAAKLKLGLGLLADSGELTPPVRRYWRSALAAAATVLVIIAAAFWFTRPTPPVPLLAASVSALGGFDRQSLLVDTYRIERTRSSGFDARLTLPPTARAICLRVLPEHPLATVYGLRLNVMDAGAALREIAQLRDLRADADGLVKVCVDSGRLQPGRYEILLSAAPGPSAATETASSFLILVERSTRP